MRKSPQNDWRFLGIRLWSSSHSADSAQPSWLAIIESVAAVVGTVWLVSRYGTVTYIALTAAIAPLLLLRTKTSTNLGIQWFDRVFELLATNRKVRLGIGGPLISIIGFVAVSFFPLRDNTLLLILVLMLWFTATIVISSFVALGIISVGSRAAATIFSLIRHPITSIGAIPRNWFRVFLCLDLAQVPEVVPGYNRDGIDDYLKLSHVRRLGPESRLEWFETRSVLVSILLISILYRWSLKATSIVYLPLIWLSWRATRRRDSILCEVKALYKGERAQIVLFISACVIFGFVVKFFAMIVLLELRESWKGAFR